MRTIFYQFEIWKNLLISSFKVWQHKIHKKHKGIRLVLINFIITVQCACMDAATGGVAGVAMTFQLFDQIFGYNL